MTSRFIPAKSKKPKVDPALLGEDGEVVPVEKKKAKPTPKKMKPSVDVPKVKPDERKLLIMADWEDAKTVDAMKTKFSLTSEQLVELFKTLVGPRDFRRWRRKVEAHLSKKRS